ncbi:invasion associated locus B family protein [Marinomonas sp. CT5]|uniref:invasion associated locus B family protein n=1 Tax=Marinomonas sp. CT5 TaxID=2066133 RepID=UPI001BAEAA14|nr:invasion associated locus B family protein [Marinomonas sp. CT5]
MTKISIRLSHITMALCAATMVFTAPLVTAAESAKQAAVSNKPLETTATYGNWVLHCVQLPSPSNGKDDQADDQADDASCEIVQSAQIQGQSRPVMQMAIGRLPGQKDFTVTTVIPVNVSIPGRVQIVIDSEAKETKKKADGFDLTLTRCLPSGCVAVTKLDNKMRAQMSAGIAGQLKFISANGQEIAIPLSWMGFTQAMTSLDKKE